MLQNIQVQIHAEEGEENAETGGSEQDPQQQGAQVQRQQPADTPESVFIGALSL